MKIKTILIVFMILFAFVNVNADELRQELDNLKIVTENDYPPIGFMKNGKMDGLGIEIVKEIMKRLKMQQEIKMWPWARAYSAATKKTNVVLFSVSRTKIRDRIFQWVGPICIMKASFYVRKDSNIKINNLEDAKKLKRIGTYRDAFDEQYLKKEGFKNLDSVVSNILNIKKLMIGRFDVITGTNITMGNLAKDAGFTINDIKPIYTFLNVGNYFTFSSEAPFEVVDLWRNTLEDMKMEGLITKLQKKWIQ